MLDSGFEILDGFISIDELNGLLGDIRNLQFPSGVGGIRNIEKKSRYVSNFCRSKKLLAKASEYLKGEAALVRAILFNKTPEQNWFVAWHQDKTVAVTKYFEADGWGPWSTKDNTLHVQPPLEVLNDMVSIRIHLDAATEENGCLKVIPLSQRHGVLTQGAIESYVSKSQPVISVAPRRSALVMRPHILHSSSKGSAPNQRRVLHLEFSSFKLLDHVKWA